MEDMEENPEDKEDQEDEFLICFTKSDLLEVFRKKGVEPKPKTLEIVGDCIKAMPIAEMFFEAATDAALLWARIHVDSMEPKADLMGIMRKHLGKLQDGPAADEDVAEWFKSINRQKKQIRKET